jgi:outer membrane receptor for ferrienterochelin and colicin
MLIRKLAAGAAMGALALAVSTAAYAQQTTGAIRGQVTDDAGKPLSGVTITVTHVPTGTKATSVTGGDGSYNLLNLRPGGPYTVEAADSTHTPQKVEVDNIALGETTDLNIAMTSGANLAEITVVASQSKGGIKVLTTGPRTVFGTEQIAELPSLNRDIKDLLQRSPLVTIDPTNSNALIVAGANNRVNTIYVDGVKQADDFGLNANGYPSQNEPFSIDWIKDLDFEVAPYDVQYGEFQGGLINVVTKEGTNTFHGSLYYQGNNSAYAGASFVQDDGADQRTINVTPFYKQTWGGTLGGPIIPDKLFFYGGYEDYRTASVPNTFGPSDGNAANKVTGLLQSDVDQITSILQTVYKYDPLGDTSGTLPQTDERWFARLDWNITDKQRLMVSYQEDDGVTLSDGGSNSSSQLTLLSQYYDLDQTLKAYNVQLFSDWTDQFSTEFAYNRKEVASIRAPLTGVTSFAQFQIRLDSGASVFLGPDISSQANELRNTDELFRFRAHYKIGDHVLTVGYERESLSVFNLFDQNANGSYIFATNTSATSGVACYPGFNVFQDLAMGQACSVTYANAANNVSTSAAANWGDVDNIAYLQDEWNVLPELVIRLGLRDEFYTDATMPSLNVPGFQNVYGFSNTATFSGRSILMPRIGFNWRPNDSFTLTGGFGLFSGGDPNVWLSNSYTNTGLLIGSVNCSLAPSKATPTVAVNSCTGPGATLTGINALTSAPFVTPTVTGLNTASANVGSGITNFIDPNFKLPSTWKGSLSFVQLFELPRLGDDWRFHGDLLYQAVAEGITWQDVYALANVLGTAPDGRPTYNNARFATCGPTTHSCYSLELTNDQLGGGITWDLGVGKAWNDGWAKGLDFDFSYTHSNVGETDPGTSSVALSNYSQWAVSDRNNPTAATSNYNVKWQAQLKAGYTHAFFKDYLSSIQVFVEDRAGLPFSYTFFSTASNNANAGDQMFGEDDAVAFRNTQLLYVPKTNAQGNVTATSDPLVTYNPTTFNAATIAAFNQYLHQTGLIKYAGEIAPRNAFDSPDVLTGNLRFEQEVPAFFPNHARFKVWFDIVNFPNLLNKKWGILQQEPFPNIVSPITASNCQVNAPTKITPSAMACANGNGDFYEYEQFFRTTTPSAANNFGLNNITKTTLDSSSDWYMDLGIKYDF